MLVCMAFPGVLQGGHGVFVSHDCLDPEFHGDCWMAVIVGRYYSGTLSYGQSLCYSFEDQAPINKIYRCLKKYFLFRVRRQVINRTNADLLSIGLLGTSLSEIWIGILSVSFKKMPLKMASANMAAILSRGRWVNSLRPADAIWHHRTWSILVQVMTCCRMTPSHYLNQCVLISKVLLHSFEGIFKIDT